MSCGTSSSNQKNEEKEVVNNMKDTIIESSNMLKIDSISSKQNEIKSIPKTVSGKNSKTSTLKNKNNSNVVFSVQIAASRVPLKEFSDIVDILIVHDDNYIKYHLGEFDSYQDAKNYKNHLSQNYAGAFVQAKRNGKIIAIEEALD